MESLWLFRTFPYQLILVPTGHAAVTSEQRSKVGVRRGSDMHPGKIFLTQGTAKCKGPEVTVPDKEIPMAFPISL